jgi:ABC-type Mn2+/Zn2+ transport system permease subunit
MNDTLQIAFGLCGLIGGTCGLIGAFIVWRGAHR